MRAFEAACKEAWLITEGGLRTILMIAARRDLDPALVAAIRAEKSPAIAQGGRRGGVAILSVDGPLFRHANLFTDISGGTSVELLRQDLAAALADPGVTAILLNVDSPGGEANGIHETAAAIRAATAVKPVTAYVSNLGASGAYWLASAASEIVADEMALVGSIGVVAAVPNPAADAGEELTFVSSQSPLKRADPTSDAGRDYLQGTLDDMADIFIGRVADYRATTPARVAADFGQGGIVIARRALAAGMIDAIGDFEGTLANLAAANPVTPVAARPAARTRGRRSMEDETTTTMGEQLPDTAMLMAQLAGMREALDAERQQREALQAQADLLTAHAAQLEGDARRKRFTDEVLGHANDGTRWLGAADENVAYLEIAAEVLGEGSEKFQTIVAHHRQLAVQFRQSGILGEVGTSQAPIEAGDNAFVQLETEARKLRESNPTLSLAQAKAQVVKENAPLREALSRRGNK